MITLNYQKMISIVKFGKVHVREHIRKAMLNDCEHAVCTFIYFRNGVSQDTIAEYLMLDKTTIAKTLKSLEKKGLVSRVQNTENRRKNVTSITDKGKETISNINGIYQDWYDTITSCFSDDEKQLFSVMCNKLSESAKDLYIRNSN
jgi:DNA-binding MarR family transcriptional regulator